MRTTLAELNHAAHAVHDPAIAMPAPARTGGVAVLPMREVIRMATDALHCLAVFDEDTGRPLYLGRQQRLASADQRILCYARDGGCTRPGCAAPGYHTPKCTTPHPGQPAAPPCRSPVLRLRPRPQTLDRGPLPHPHHRHRAAGLDRRHHPTPNPPRINHLHHPDELLRNNPDPPDDG